MPAAERAGRGKLYESEQGIEFRSECALSGIIALASERSRDVETLNPIARPTASKSATDRVQGVLMRGIENKTGAFVTTRLFRRLVLGAAFFVALAVALVPDLTAVHAQEPKSSASPPAGAAAPDAPKLPGVPNPPEAAKGRSMVIKDGHGAEIKIDISEGGRKTITRTIDPGAKAKADADADPDADGDSGLQKRAKKRAQVIIDGLGDKEFDSFDEFVHDEPALAAMVIAVVATVFFAPVLAIALILWYRMRKARMLNETMLKLAEKGIVPSAEAIDALGGKPAAAAAMAPYLEQAKQVRRRAAWSDLRKGVLMGGFGFALSLHSLMTSRSPNIVGLVLLCVGLGFIVLWWFEQRHLPAPDGVAPSAATGPGSLPPGTPPPT